MTGHIQVGDASPRAQYVANGSQTVFPYPFPIFAAADIEVWVGAARQGASAYSVSGAGTSEGGSVAFVAAPSAGTIVTLRRRLTLRRTSDFHDDGIIRAKVVNDEFDYQTMSVQQVAEDVGRAVKRAHTSSSTADLTLPEPMPGRAIKWNSAATGLENSVTDVDQMLTQATLRATEACASAQTASASAATATARASEAINAAVTATAAAASAVSAVGFSLDADPVMAAASDKRVATQRAVKAYADSAATIAGVAAKSYADASTAWAMEVAATSLSAAMTPVLGQIALSNLRQLLNTGVSTGALVQGKQWELSTDEWASGSSGYSFAPGAIPYYSAGVESYGPNICSGGVAISSGDYSGTSASCAFDGNASSWWGSAQGAPAGVAYIGYNFGATARRIGKIMLTQPPSNNNISSVIVQKWDGFSWVDVSTIALEPKVSTPQTLRLPPGLASTQWRVLANSNASVANSPWAVYEIQMMEALTLSNATLVSSAPIPVSTPPAYASLYALYKDDSIVTNLLTYSEQFEDPSYIKYGTCTVTSNVDGTLADRLSNISSYSNRMLKLSAIPGNGMYTLSFWAKSNGGGVNIAATLIDNTGGNNVNFYTLTPDWQRYTVSIFVVGNTAPFEIWGEAGTTSFDLWGAQLNAGTVAPYIYTGPSPVSGPASLLGTDLTVELSRDGGTTWSPATITPMVSFDGTYTVLRARAKLSDQPSGTALMARVKILNSKAQRIAAPALYAE
ncbi:phage head spike fiber domain-containing protein [Magnetospirillum molischianum]|uniref:Uncharacterized protein n=1 Tax=Magnetospirillum molischianum DSM 120 TaxID=1150626 RepID=H8FUC6_MAGML|nr:hypothetical protein [Magnetospirillum molischianum]CCG41964.1 hypothetical protein PHAMO_30120 [Magnetospirillum molischianum DSM 120]